MPLDRRARARVRKRRSKVCSFGKNGKKRVPRSRHFFFGGGVFFRAYFFSFLFSKKDTKKKYDSERPQNYFREQNSDVSLSLSLISLPADTIMRRILLPIDSTGEDVDVLKWVIENVHRAGDQIVLLHVYVSLFLYFLFCSLRCDDDFLFLSLSFSLCLFFSPSQDTRTLPTTRVGHVRRFVPGSPQSGRRKEVARGLCKVRRGNSFADSRST